MSRRIQVRLPAPERSRIAMAPNEALSNCLLIKVRRADSQSVKATVTAYLFPRHTH